MSVSKINKFRNHFRQFSFDDEQTFDEFFIKHQKQMFTTDGGYYGTNVYFIDLDYIDINEPIYKNNLNNQAKFVLEIWNFYCKNIANMVFFFIFQPDLGEIAVVSKYKSNIISDGLYYLKEDGKEYKISNIEY